MNFQSPISTSQKMVKRISTSLILLAAGCWLLAAKISAQDTWEDPTGENPAQFKDIETVFSNITGIIFPLGGIAVFIMFLAGGFQHLTTGGNPENTQKAWNTITYAALGLVLLVGIWFILRIIHQFTGVDVTEFKVVQE